MTEKEIQELKAENEKLRNATKQHEAEIKRLNDEQAKKIDALRKDLKAGKVGVLEIPGQVKLSLLVKGTKKAQTFKIANNHPKVRLGKNRIIQSAVLLKIANGDELSEEELAQNPEAEDLDKAGALEFLGEMASIGAAWLQEVKPTK